MDHSVRNKVKENLVKLLGGDNTDLALALEGFLYQRVDNNEKKYRTAFKLMMRELKTEQKNDSGHTINVMEQLKSRALNVEYFVKLIVEKVKDHIDELGDLEINSPKSSAKPAPKAKAPAPTKPAEKKTTTPATATAPAPVPAPAPATTTTTPALVKQSTAPAQPQSSVQSTATAAADAARPAPLQKSLSVEGDAKKSDSSYYFFKSTSKEEAARFAPKALTQEQLKQKEQENAVKTGFSAWNKGGTWEDMDTSEQTREYVKKAISLITDTASDGRTITIDVTKCEGESSIALIRGKKKLGFELNMKGEILLTDVAGEVTTGKFEIDEVDEVGSKDGDFDIDVKCSNSAARSLMRKEVVKMMKKRFETIRDEITSMI